VSTRAIGSTQIPDFSPSHDDLDRLIYAAPVGQTSWCTNAHDRFDNRWQQNVTADSGPAPK